MHDILNRLYKLKVILLALVTAFLGLALLFFAKWAQDAPGWEWTTRLPIFELGSTLFITGSLVIAWDYIDGKDREVREDARLRRLLAESAPAFREAVVRGFAVESDDLKRVATPELLDGIATNTLALRFGDKAFAHEVYSDILSQAIKASERWHDARVSIDLAIARSDTTGVTPLFDVVVRWEYTVSPAHRYRRFAVVSDRRRYNELAAEAGETSVWFKNPQAGLDAADPGTFSLVQFTVGDQECRINRHADKSSQTFSVDLGEDVVREAEPIVVSFTYQTRTPQSGHVLHFDIDRPTRGLDVELTYDGCGIAAMRMFDFVSSGEGARISTKPETTSNKVIRYGYDGWLFPRAGLVFVWTLDRETGTSATINERAHHTKTA